MVHAKSDSEVTMSIEGSTPPHSPAAGGRQQLPLYFVQSPPHDLDNYFSTPSPMHHSRHSSTYSATHHLSNFKLINSSSSWPTTINNNIKYNGIGDDDDDDDILSHGTTRITDTNQLRFYLVCFLLAFALLFASFSLILWASSFAYTPHILVKSIVFENFNVQAGMDFTGVPTDMLTLNSTVRIFYRNPATYFGVHVTSTPILLHYFDLKLATAHMTKFYQSRKSQRIVTAQVQGHQVPLYGGIPLVTVAKGHPDSMSVPLNLTFVMQSRAYILGKLVNPRFYRTISCQVTLRGKHLGRSLNLTKMHSCLYR